MADTESRHPLTEAGGASPSGSGPSAAGGIEQEIDTLRRAMIRTYQEESSFNAERVIEISRRLDRMINEYMRSKLSRSSG